MADPPIATTSPENTIVGPPQYPHHIPALVHPLPLLRRCRRAGTVSEPGREQPDARSEPLLRVPCLTHGQQTEFVGVGTVKPPRQARVRMRLVSGAGEPLGGGDSVSTVSGELVDGLGDGPLEREDFGGHELVGVLGADRVPVHACRRDGDLRDQRLDGEFDALSATPRRARARIDPVLAGDAEGLEEGVEGFDCVGLLVGEGRGDPTGNPPRGRSGSRSRRVPGPRSPVRVVESRRWRSRG